LGIKLSTIDEYEDTMEQSNTTIKQDQSWVVTQLGLNTKIFIYLVSKHKCKYIVL
jgi:hypothetical protein